MFLSQDENILYIEMEEEFEKPNSDSQARPKKHSKTIMTWHTSYVQHRQALLKPPRNLKVRSKIKLFS